MNYFVLSIVNWPSLNSRLFIRESIVWLAVIYFRTFQTSCLLCFEYEILGSVQVLREQLYLNAPSLLTWYLCKVRVLHRRKFLSSSYCGIRSGRHDRIVRGCDVYFRDMLITVRANRAISPATPPGEGGGQAHLVINVHRVISFRWPLLHLGTAVTGMPAKQWRGLSSHFTKPKLNRYWYFIMQPKQTRKERK